MLQNEGIIFNYPNLTVLNRDFEYESFVQNDNIIKLILDVEAVNETESKTLLLFIILNSS